MISTINQISTNYLREVLKYQYRIKSETIRIWEKIVM